MIDFDAFINKAYELKAAEKTDGEPAKNVGILNGKVVTLTDALEGVADAETVKRDFINAAVEKFGDKFRADLENIVNKNDNAKPLSARTILEVDHFIQGNASTVNRLVGIMNRIPGIAGSEKTTMADIDKIFDSIDRTNFRKDALAEWNTKLLGAAAEASTRLEAALSLTAKDFASAYGENSDESIKAIVKGAIDSQMELADALREFDNKTRGTIKGLEELSIRAYSRATELFTLAAELSAVEEEKLAKADVKKLLAAEGARMHGSTDAFVQIEDRIAPLLARATGAKLRAKEGGASACADVAVILAELEAAKAELLEVAEKGVETPNGTWKVNPDYFKAAAKSIDETAGELRKFTSMSATDVLVSFADSLYKGTHNNLLAKVNKAAVAWAKDPTKEAYDALDKACQRAASTLRRGSGRQRFLLNLPKRLAAVKDILVEGKIPAEFKSDKMLALLLENRLDFKTVALARAWGATDDMVDVDISDKNLVGLQKLGNGQANTVFLCKYNGIAGEKTYVFKPEIPADQAFKDFTVAREGYRDVESVAHLNAAAGKVAEALGTPDTVVGVKTGCLNGNFGIFMEVAPGASFDDMQRNPGKDWGLASPSKVSNLGKDEYYKLSANFMRAGFDLEWNDCLTGQGDRHWGNYLVDIDANQNVKLRGIDNDLSFPSWRLGMMRFKISGANVNHFAYRLGEVGLQSAGTLEGLAAIYANKPGFTFAPDGKSLTVDLDKVVDDKLKLFLVMKKTFGIQVIAKPAAISEAMYTKLKELDQNREAFRASLAPHIGEEAIEATLARLDDMLEHAMELEKKGRVMREENWGDKKLIKKISYEQVPAEMMKWSRKDRYAMFYRMGIYQRDFQGMYGKQLH